MRACVMPSPVTLKSKVNVSNAKEKLLANDLIKEFLKLGDKIRGLKRGFRFDFPIKNQILQKSEITAAVFEAPCLCSSSWNGLIELGFLGVSSNQRLYALHYPPELFKGSLSAHLGCDVALWKLLRVATFLPHRRTTASIRD